MNDKNDPPDNRVYVDAEVTPEVATKIYDALKKHDNGEMVIIMTLVDKFLIDDEEILSIVLLGDVTGMGLERKEPVYEINVPGGEA